MNTPYGIRPSSPEDRSCCSMDSVLVFKEVMIQHGFKLVHDHWDYWGLKVYTPEILSYIPFVGVGSTMPVHTSIITSLNPNTFVGSIAYGRRGNELVLWDCVRLSVLLLNDRPIDYWYDPRVIKYSATSVEELISKIRRREYVDS